MTSQTNTPHHVSRTTMAIAVGCAVIFGAAVALQSRVNGELGHQLGDGFVAALISFGLGLVIMIVALAFSRSGRRGLGEVRSAVVERRIPWWYVMGGAAGAFLVLSQGLTAAALGVALFTVAIVAGQTLSGLVIDRRGIGTMAPKPVTTVRLVGAGLALVAVIFAVSARLVDNVPVWLMIMPLIGGVGIGWQQAVNGQVRVLAKSAITATFINFTVGTIILAIAAVVHAGIVGWPQALPTNPWLYTGGAIGVVFIAGAAIVVKTTGVLLMGLANVAGQLVMSLVLDAVAPVAGHEIALTTVLGTALTLIAVGITAIPSRKTVPAKL